MRALEKTDEIPNQFNTSNQRELYMSQPKNKCFVVSKLPHPAAHVVSFEGMTRRLAKLSFVGSLSLKRRHTNKDTFEGINLCQMSSTRDISTTSLGLVIK